MSEDEEINIEIDNNTEIDDDFPCRDARNIYCILEHLGGLTKEDLSALMYFTKTLSVDSLAALLSTKLGVYYIHDNGGRPFQVLIKNGNVQIRKYGEGTLDTYINALEFKPETIFIGHSTKSDRTGERSYGDEYDGNSILLHLTGLKYVYIGSVIYEFTALAEIIDYYSQVGPNDVPYPYAVDVAGNVYLFNANVILLNYTHTHNIAIEDPYWYFYNNQYLSPNIGNVNPGKGYNGITAAFYTGNEISFEPVTGIEDTEHEITFHWESDPKDMYTRLPKFRYIQNGESISPTLEEFTELLDSFARNRGFQVLPVKVLVDRQI